MLVFLYMKQVKTILVFFSGMSLMVAGLLGVALVFDFATEQEAGALFVRLVLALAIAAVVAAGLTLLSQLNRD